VVLRAGRVEDRDHGVRLYGLWRDLDRLRGVLLVVEVLVGDPAPEDAALRVEVLEVRLGTASDRRI